MTKDGKIVLIEAKGDYLDGDDSKSKLHLGEWLNRLGACIAILWCLRIRI